MATDIATLLDEFEQSVRDDDFAAALSRFEQIEQQYDTSLRVEEEQRSTRAIEAVHNDDVDVTDEAALREYIGLELGAGFSRAPFLLTGVGYLTDPTTVSRSDVLEVTDQLRDLEADLDQATTAVADDLAELYLPHLLSLVDLGVPEGYHPLGTSETATVTVANFGDEPVEGVDANASVTDGVNIDPEQVDFGTLQGGDVESAELAIEYNEAGSHELTVDISIKGDTVEREAEPFEVNDRLDILEILQKELADLETKIENIEAIDDDARDALLSSVDTAQYHVDRAYERTDEEKANEKELKPAKNVLNEALINKLDAAEDEDDEDGDGLRDMPAAERFTIKHGVEELVELMDITWEAEY